MNANSWVAQCYCIVSIVNIGFMAGLTIFIFQFCVKRSFIGRLKERFLKVWHFYYLTSLLKNVIKHLWNLVSFYEISGLYERSSCFLWQLLSNWYLKTRLFLLLPQTFPSCFNILKFPFMNAFAWKLRNQKPNRWMAPERRERCQ